MRSSTAVHFVPCRRAAPTAQPQLPDGRVGHEIAFNDSYEPQCDCGSLACVQQLLWRAAMIEVQQILHHEEGKATQR
jgi:hypothetical protein